MVSDRPPAAKDHITVDDWPAQAADTIERVVGSVRDKTTGPAITAARAVVYGTFALFVGLMVAVLFSVVLVRILDVYLPSAVFGDEHVWAAHGLVGLLFTIAGAFLWSKRTARPD
ncbi:MAG TPA: hypothetical protein VIR58_16615 [Acidimicrobiales bacterium]